MGNRGVNKQVKLLVVMDLTFQWEGRRTIEKKQDTVKFWQGYKDTNRKRNGTGFQELSSKGSVECWFSQNWLLSALPNSVMPQSRASPLPELAGRHLAAQLGRRSSMRVSLKGHQERSQSCDTLEGRKSKPRDTEAGFVGNQERQSIVFYDKNRILL